MSNRRGTPERRITADEVTHLAERIFAWKEKVWAYRWKVLAPQLASVGRSDGT